MKKFKKLINRCVFSEALPLEMRVLNMICLVGIAAALVATISRILLGNSLSTFLVMMGIVISIASLLYINNRYYLYRLGTWITLIVLGDILFPLAFFQLGGSRGGMAAYFVLSIVIIFLLTRGRKCALLLVIHTVLIITCYGLSYFVPRLLSPFSEFQALLDNVQSLLVAGFFLGTVVKFQDRIYRMEEKKVEDSGKELVRHDKLLHVINNAAVSLLTSDPDQFEDALRQSLEMMARCVDINRIIVWRNHMLDGSLSYTRIYAWDESTGLIRDDAQSAMEFSYSKSIPEWETTLAGGRCVNGPVRGLSETEQERLLPYGILSILVIPVFLQDYFWGFVSFDDCRREREFPETEEAILRSGSLLIANAMARNEMTQNLVSARESALSGARAKSEFLSNMSHEIRTPLNAIIGMTAIAKNSAEIERKDYCLGKINDASTHLLGVINDILDMSKIEANKFDLSLAEFNFENILQRAVNVINFRVDEKNQRLAVYVDKHIPRTLIGDDQRITQVIANILSNAVKFTPEGGSIRLDAALVKEDGKICTIEIKVTDTGIGISEERQSRLFSSFEQADSGISRKFGGTGLGLAISKNIVEMMGGKIWVKSEPGKGSTFAFTVQAEHGPEASEAPADIPAPMLNYLRVLVVDDEREVLDYFKDIASRFGFSCDTVISGEEALETIERNKPYNICFVDWKLPGINGIDLARKIRDPACFAGTKQGETGTGLPAPGELFPVVILISATDWSVIEADARSAGVNRFLPKPLFPSSIMDCINECVGIDKLRAPEKAQSAKGDNFEGCRVLLAEDVEINREIVIALLEPTGLDVDCAKNGAEAVQRYSENPGAYQMIFMDVQMPEMDGYEATRRIRAFEEEQRKKPAPGFPAGTPGEHTEGVPAFPKGIPIIAMTANVFREDIEKCLESGMNDHVGKPLDFNEVLEKLRRFLPIGRAAAGFWQ
ncbi:MAG: response regulator [Treponema sp.]|jgi:signal transduction histidine kinase/DNA-binding response OmpR family regulator|nr:response regulator [Treponema sp.]